MTAAEQILATRVTLGYGKKEVVKGVDLSIRKGEFLSIIGPSGVGKTTLLMSTRNCWSHPNCKGYPMLTVENLNKQFLLHILNGKEIDAFHNISFRAPAGGFLGLAGPSGAGKSTVLKCIYRTYLPSSGSISYDSAQYGPVDLVTMPDRGVIDIRTRELGYVSQFLKVVPRVSALEVVMEPIIARNGVSHEAARKRAAELLERLRIPSRLFDAYPATFSGGEQQRINIAHAISWKPRLLLLDEPTASLDKESVNTVVELLQELRHEGTTMIGIFHDTALMERITDAVHQIA